MLSQIAGNRSQPALFCSAGPMAATFVAQSPCSVSNARSIWQTVSEGQIKPGSRRGSPDVDLPYINRFTCLSIVVDAR